MSTEIKKYEFLNFTGKENFPTAFVDIDENEYKNRESEVEFTLLCFEIKSALPPYNSFIKISHKEADSTLKNFTIDLGEYRNDIFFENGLYILYLATLKEIPKNLFPINCRFFNKRDENATACLVYKTKFKK